MRSTLFTITIVSWSAAIQAAVIPSDGFAISGDEKIPSKHKSDEYAVEYQLPESVSTYASNWGDNYQTYRYHSLMHQPEPFAFGETNDKEDTSFAQVRKESRFPWFGDGDVDEDAFERDEAEEEADNLFEVEIGEGSEDEAPAEDEAIPESHDAAEEVEDDYEVAAEEDDDDDDDELVAEEEDDDEEGTSIEEEDITDDSETLDKRSEEFSDIAPLVIEDIGLDQAERKDRVSSNSTAPTNSTVGNSPCIVPLYDHINELDESERQPSSPGSNRHNSTLAQQKKYANEGVEPISCAMFGITVALAFCTTML